VEHVMVRAVLELQDWQAGIATLAAGEQALQ
jgi:hypothetical protein